MIEIKVNTYESRLYVTNEGKLCKTVKINFNGKPQSDLRFEVLGIKHDGEYIVNRIV